MAEKTTTNNGVSARAGAAMISSGEITNKILERFEKEETVLTKSGERVTDGFRKLLRQQMGLKADYLQLSREEKIVEARERIRSDFKVAREEIKKQNPVDYLLDRALDPLDPMNVVYKIILKTLGAEIDGRNNAIRLSPELNSILLSCPGFKDGRSTNHHKKEVAWLKFR
ncbi:hypothetical protein HY947_04910 [Candidatus Gottesmanbacteria bacterium]|nr:hypothetical protein [Candidatus Gottesmanbacteria bacterium]